MTPYELISKWHDSELRERQGAQEWFLDVCRLAGHPTPAESDKTGETFCRDAILDLTDPGDPREPEWPKVDFIVGNPPFLGGKFLRRELGDEYVDRPFELWDGRVRREADLCCYWFEKARAAIVLDAYGWPDTPSDDDLLERLLTLNLRASSERDQARRGVP